MNDAAKIFADDWYERGDENGDCQIFWMTLLRDVFAVENPERLIKFQKPVAGKHIDAYIARTKVLIEQKSFGVDLTKKILQSDGEPLTAFEQAARYAKILPADEKPRWIVTCNFSEFRIYNVAEKIFEREPVIIKLRDLRYQFRRLEFLIDPAADTTPPEEKISAEAVNIIKKICETFDKNYQRNKNKIFRDALGKLCTRLVFCFYADDSDLFAAAKFVDYLKNFPVDKLQDALQNFFAVINTPRDRRKNFDDALKNFPYVNGGLFDERLTLPPLNQRFKFELEHAHDLRWPSGNPRMDDEQKNFLKFSWREIDPPVFGAMFESVVGTQRESGMYYTSVDNIHKVIDPLFFDDLRDEFDRIKHMRKVNRVAALKNFQDKLAALNFFDPACGSGNFLTETYRSLRRLENEILEELRRLREPLPKDPVKVSINQFFGIEIDSFAVAVAQTALWIAEIQMLRETEGAIGKNLKILPLTKYVTIICANALQIDWKTVAPNVDFIIGNPPFVGARLKSAAQARDMQIVFDDSYNIGNLDYVTCWYKKATDYIRGTKIRCAFVSTNSVCQGDSVGALWKNLFAEGIHIDFAHRTFKWLSDSDNLAHVHCVVVGFSCAPNLKPKKIFDGKKVFIAENINAYLVDGENIFVESRNEPLQAGVLSIGIGNKPIDDGNYLFTPEEMDEFIKREPASAKYFRPWYGATEFIKGKRRFCLWLKDLSLDEIKKMPLVAERVEAVKKYRSFSKSAGTRKIADKPTRFHVENFPRGNYIAIPKTSSERRFYIPIGFMNESAICADSLRLVADAKIYHFGILTSSVHMAWTRATCGRLKSDYSYSNKIVYNNFPWPEISARRRRMIEQTAQKILDVRAEFPTWTFAALYDEETMPDELRLAHRSNDYAVAIAYGFEKFLDDEPKIVAELMKLYQRLATR